MTLDRAARWLWADNRTSAHVARASLWPAAAAYAVCARARAYAYRRGILPTRRVPVPTIAVGNLTVGGTGKTPIASWIAARCAARGFVPGIVLRGYGHDEAAMHRERLPAAIVVQGRDRLRAAQQAVELGAGVIVLDDGFQRLDIRRDINLLLVSAESCETRQRTLPAGPWREPWTAARRADAVIVTRKRASADAARRTAHWLVAGGGTRRRVAVVHLCVGGLTDLVTGRVAHLTCLRGARVLVACAIADPMSFADQVAGLGASVRMMTWRDHHEYAATDMRRLLSAAADVDYVVTTHKDAVKLRRLWPAEGPGAFVAHVSVEWEAGTALVPMMISDLLTRHYTSGMY